MLRRHVRPARKRERYRSLLSCGHFILSREFKPLGTMLDCCGGSFVIGEDVTHEHRQPRGVPRRV
jgi:hypothetical protein